jgi:signal transduction histidine kinase/ligand-binding sensor domain-containing protein/DNA-binding response OmpR family regulator
MKMFKGGVIRVTKRRTTGLTNGPIYYICSDAGGYARLLAILLLMKSKKTLLIFLACLSFTRQYGQTYEYQFSHLDFTNGLSNNHVTSLYKDARGFMWFGTMVGLNRYDGYQFRVFQHDPKDPHSIVDNYIEQIFEGPEGKMWVESRAGRFNIYDAVLDQFDPDYAAYLTRLSLPASRLLRIVGGNNSVAGENSSAARGVKGYWFIYQSNGVFYYGADKKIVRATAIDPSPITDGRQDREGNCWVVHQNGLLEKIDGLQHKVVYRSTLLEKEFGGNALPSSLYIDGQDDCWIYSNGAFKGVYYYRPGTEELRHLSEDAGEKKLSSNVVINALQDDKGRIWLATDHGGVDILDKKDFSEISIGHIENDRKSLPENSVTCLYKDSTGTIWLGTFKNGISYCHQNGIRFPQYRHQPNNPGSLPYDDVNNFAEDTAGNIWIASNGGGLIYFDRKHNRFRQYLHDPARDNSLCNDIIVSLLVDKDDKLWIGTYFGGLDCYDGKKFIHYRHNDKIPGSLADDRVMCLYEDSDRDLWIGTLASGMDRLDRKKKCFIHYTSAVSGSIRNNYISSIVEDGQKNLWIATAYGIDVLQRSNGQFIHYSSDSNQLSSDNVIVLFRDSRQRMWAATREGLNLFLSDRNSFQSFSTDNGLPDNTIRSILEDNRHELWAGTVNGLARIQVKGLRIRCRNYHEQDGLQGREFNERSALVTRDGYLLFGGPDGFNLFHPESIVNTGKAPPIVLTGLEIFNKSVNVGEKRGGHVILDKALTETGQITLNHSEDVFSIEFASLGFIDNARNKYAYILEEFNKNWLTTDGNIRKATYTNLDAGTYTFRVKASDEDGQWYDRQATLKIIVLPPFWKTPLAYIVYVLLLAGVLLLSRRMIIQKTRMRFALEQERQETRRMHEIDLMKIRFFTNMSHELRTPLSLILTPVEKLLGNPQQPDPKKQYEVIRRNARRLLHLVNQLLDFRKMEVHELKLQPRQGDIVKFVKEISFSFVDLAERKNISFSYHGDGLSLLTLFDHDKIERILFNLLSNAFKFTPENGAVSVTVNTEQEAETVLLSIKVQDSGIGIAPDKQEKIFERFFQTEVPDTILNQGSGIGLSITQEFVKMHGGQLTVESQLNQGSCFTVSLPFTPSASVAPPPAPPEVQPSAAAPDHGVTPSTPGNTRKRSILLVEDNEDFRFYLKDNLRASYAIIEAADGKEGWRKALAEHPDLVVSDISMPVMNGIELCKKIRSDERTRQIPVILLTAMAGEGAELNGLQTGAIDYIIKPFNFELLLSKIRNVLEYNETIKKTYQRQVQANPSTLQIASADDAFMQNVLEQIEKNMSNPDFSVGELSLQFHASRSTFYKRLLLLTGKTPIEFIRHIRLKRAAELLEKSQLTISEIAYTVGFNNPKNFSQHFKMEFGRIPSAYRAERKGKHP